MAIDTNHIDFSSAEGIALVNLQDRIEQEAVFKAMGQEPRRNNAGFMSRAEDRDPEEERSQVGRDSYLIMASGRSEFAISDLEPYYFGASEGDDEDGGVSSGLFVGRQRER